MRITPPKRVARSRCVCARRAFPANVDNFAFSILFAFRARCSFSRGDFARHLCERMPPSISIFCANCARSACAVFAKNRENSGPISGKSTVLRAGSRVCASSAHKVTWGCKKVSYPPSVPNLVSGGCCESAVSASISTVQGSWSTTSRVWCARG